MEAQALERAAECMSIKSEWKKVELWWKARWNEVKKKYLVDDDPNDGTGCEYPWDASAVP